MASFLFEEECKSYLLPELEAPNEHTEVEYDEYDNVKPPHAFPVALLDSQNKINECYTSYLVAWSLLEDGTMADASARTAFISMVDSCPDTLMAQWQESINNGLFPSHKFKAEHIVDSESFEDAAQTLIDDLNDNGPTALPLPSLEGKAVKKAQGERKSPIDAKKYKDAQKNFKADLWGGDFVEEKEAFNVNGFEKNFFGGMKSYVAGARPDVCLDKIHM